MLEEKSKKVEQKEVEDPIITNLALVPKAGQKCFNMKIGYPILKSLLLERGWFECRPS